MRTLLLVFLFSLVLLFLLQRLVDYLLFQPMAGVDIDPRDLGLYSESFHLATEDGVRIHAFFVPYEGSDRALLFLHGNAGNASHRLPNAQLLNAMELNVLVLDYRGYGLSDGTATAEGVEIDARAGLAHLVDERGFAMERVFVFGRSMGGAVAIDLAQHRHLAGVIVESTFSSLHDMVARFIGPFAELMSRRRFDSLSKVRNLRAPLLAFHGDLDEVVPYELGLRLYEAVPTEKAWETLEGAHHNDTVQRGGGRYLARIQAFIDRHAPLEPRPPARR